MEERTKYEINLPEGQKEMVIREGTAAKVRERSPLKIKGIIDLPLRYLQNRYETNLKNIARQCHVIVNEENGFISLVVDENSELGDEFTGFITESEAVKKFSINDGDYIPPDALAEFLRMRKHYFLSPTEYANTFTALRSFEAKVKQDIASIKDDSGNYDIKRKQAVEHNVPKSFVIKVPIFKGFPPLEINVEILVNSQLQATLYSADLIQLSDELRQKHINDIVTEIQKVAPDIVILYQ